jgi:uncharacterized protein with HEPN domain
MANLVIPATIWGDPVISIRNEAFKNTNLTSVIISDGITSISGGAFKDSGLTGVTIANSVTSIGFEAFKDNKLTRVAIPDSVISIGEAAFSNNQLTSVTIGNGVTTIGKEVFKNNKLTTLTIPNNVKSIGEAAFFDNSLKSVIISDSVTSIGKEAFRNNQFFSSLKEITIGSNVRLEGDPFLCYHYSNEEQRWIPEITPGTRSGFLYMYNRYDKKAGTYWKDASWHFDTPQEAKAKELEKLGADAYSRKDFAKAKSYLEEALKLNPKNEGAKALLKKVNNELNKQNKQSAKK